MPQMSPMSWTLIFIMLMIFTMLTLSNMHFLKTPSMNIKIMKKKENSMKW